MAPTRRQHAVCLGLLPLLALCGLLIPDLARAQSAMQLWELSETSVDTKKKKNKVDQEPGVGKLVPAGSLVLRVTGRGNVQDNLFPTLGINYVVPFRADGFFTVSVAANVGDMTTLADTTKEGRQGALDALRGSKEGAAVALSLIMEPDGDPDGNFRGVVSVAGRSNLITLPDGSQVEFDRVAFGVGFELGLGDDRGTNRHPLQISLRQLSSWFSKADYARVFGSEKDRLDTTELLLFLPLSNAGAGVNFESVFTPRRETAWQASLVVVPK